MPVEDVLCSSVSGEVYEIAFVFCGKVLAGRKLKSGLFVSLDFDASPITLQIVAPPFSGEHIDVSEILLT